MCGIATDQEMARWLQIARKRPVTAMLDILLVRQWTRDSVRIRASLRAHGLSARITRVDFPAALHAALLRTTFHFVLFDAQTSAVSHDILAATLREHAQSPPIVIIDDDDVGALVAARVQHGRN
jgi:hypothetical protein